MADDNITALRRLVSSTRHFQNIGSNPVGQMRTGLGNARPALYNGGSGDHRGAGNGGEILFEDGFKLAPGSNLRQV